MTTTLTYGLQFDKKREVWTTLEATKYDKNGNPISWAIRDGKYVVSKYDGNFYGEPSPSYRDEAYYQEFRFATPEEAIKFWNERWLK